MPTTSLVDRRQLEILLSQLGEQAPERTPTSPGEATMAALVNGRLRHVGLGVASYELRVSPKPGLVYVALGGMGLLAALLSSLAPLTSLVLAFNLLAFVALDQTGQRMPPMGRRRPSQNIVGTRAIRGATGLAPAKPRWRLVLLAPLDAPRAYPGLAAFVAPTRRAVMLRMGSMLLVGLGAAAALFNPILGWIVSGAGGLACLLLMIAALRPLPAHPVDGGLVALATLITAAEQLSTLRHVELWAVTVGATGSDPRGLTSLLERFPFEPSQTLFIALDPLASAQIQGIGALRDDPRLQTLGPIMQATEPTLALKLDRAPHPASLGAPIFRHGHRLIQLEAPAPSAATPVPIMSHVQTVERTTALVVAVAQALDAGM